MSLNDHAKPRSRWPAQFDVEGVPRDSATRTKKMEEQMQISSINDVGVFDFNSPPKKPYQFQEFPKRLYRGKESQLVPDKETETLRLKDGWQLKPVKAGLPSAEDLDAVAAEDQTAQKTAKRK